MYFLKGDIIAAQVIYKNMVGAEFPHSTNGCFFFNQRYFPISFSVCQITKTNPFPAGADTHYVGAVVLHLNTEEQSGSTGELSSQHNSENRLISMQGI